MATLVSSIITDARTVLKETTASYWTDAELVAHFNKGKNDLWGAIIDLHQEHFLTVDTTHVTFDADTESLTGVPTDVFRVHLIEPLDTTSTGETPYVIFYPRDYNAFEFRNARQLTSQDPSNGLALYYCLTQAGAPVGAPTVLVAPKVSSQMALRFVYVPTLALVTSSDNNPIPGASDNAMMAWVIAYARAKEREDRSPDPDWIAIYKTEKDNLLTRLTPRQSQEPDVVEDMFGVFN